MIRVPPTHYAGVPIGELPTLSGDGISFVMPGYKLPSSLLGFTQSPEVTAWRDRIRAKNTAAAAVAIEQSRLKFGGRHRPAKATPGDVIPKGGAQRPDEARQLDRNAILGPAGSQAGGFPSPRGGGRGEGANSYGAALLHP